MWHSYFAVETAGRVFVSSTSKFCLCLISLLNRFIFSPGRNLNNNGEKSFLLHLKLEEEYGKFSDKSPSSKNSVTQIAVATKIFTKMVATWVSSCWHDRQSTSTVLVGFPCLFWCFLQFSMLVMPLSKEDTMNFLKAILIDSDFTKFWKFPGKNVKQNYK